MTQGRQIFGNAEGARGNNIELQAVTHGLRQISERLFLFLPNWSNQPGNGALFPEEDGLRELSSASKDIAGKVLQGPGRGSAEGETRKALKMNELQESPRDCVEEE